MREAGVSLLATWENFYVIIGSSAGALTGLMFVVITLITGSERRRESGTIGAFGTPTVVHFCLALLVAALLTAPWQVLWNVALLLGLVGLGGVIYVFIVVRRTRRQNFYQPVLEDWLWHIVFPLVSYLSLVIAAMMLPANPTLALFITGAVSVLLLFIGIHNSWDTVTYIAVEFFQTENRDQDEKQDELQAGD
jgi:hypothetical protein